MTVANLNRSPFLRCLIIGTLCVALTTIGPAWAGPNGPQPRDEYPQPGQILEKVPGRHQTVRAGKDNYIFHEGVYYHRDPKGYRVVRPLRGIVVDRLPLGFETLVIAGITYFLFAGIYYRQTDAGYTVVDTPQAETAPNVSAPVTGQQTLVVNAKLLNVRYGPGMDHAVIDQVRMGDRLVIEGTSPGWYYVRLPNGKRGWVMSRYTRQILPDAEG